MTAPLPDPLPASRGEGERRRSRRRHVSRAARGLAAIAVAAVLVAGTARRAEADAYTRAAAAADDIPGDRVKVRAGWNEALDDLDAIPKARRKPMHCYWRSLLLYKLERSDEADAARMACTGELLRATAPAVEKRAEAINDLAREAATAARRDAQALASQRSEEADAERAATSECYLAREADHGRLDATTRDLRSLQKRLADLNLRVRELTSDPQIRKRIESVESLKAAKGQLDRADTGAQ